MSEGTRAIIAQRIIEGIRQSTLRMLERKAKLGESVIVAAPDGSPCKITAAEAIIRFKNQIQ